MRKLFLFIFVLTALTGNGQGICISVDCKDTFRYPVPVTLNGLCSSPNGIKSRLWKVTSGTATIQNSNKDTALATGMNANGIYVFSLTATSNQSAVAVAFDTVIYFANQPPQAVLGTTINTTANTATLSGSGSFDFEGLPITYNWVELSGPNVAAISTPTMSNPIVSGLINGTYVFRLTVTDIGGLISSGTQTVIVNVPVTLVKTVITTVKTFSDGHTETTVVTVP